ncbi:MAG TPA: hypothetical protein VHK69_03390 [Chitinophagaceae bacterium]|jgi:hypothetical protein|nr:hypothetical protein [Chitinophagaceae bacterium]
MLSRYTFDGMTPQQQADTLLLRGSFLYSRQEPEFLVDLYRMDGFYVEIYYHKREADIVAVRSFYVLGENQKVLTDEKIRYMHFYAASMPSA